MATWGRTRVARGVAALACAAGFLGGTPAAHAATVPDLPRLGVSGEIMPLLLEQDEQSGLAALDSMAAAGIRSTRALIEWAVVQPYPASLTAGRPVYRWDRYDAYVGALASRGIRMYALLCCSTSFSGKVLGGSTSPPGTPSDFAAFAGAVAQRYGPDGAFWRENPDVPLVPVLDLQLWNEQNASFTPVEPDEYATLVETTARTVRALVPRVRIVLGGLDGRLGTESYLTAMVKAVPAIGTLVDAAAVHLYMPTSALVLERLAAFRRALRTAGLALPIDVSEVGWTTARNSGPAGVPGEQDRVDLYQDLGRDILRNDCGVRSVHPHTWWDDSEFRLERPFSLLYGLAYGLVDPRRPAVLLPSGRAWRDAVETDQRSEGRAVLDLCGPGLNPPGVLVPGEQPQAPCRASLRVVRSSRSGVAEVGVRCQKRVHTVSMRIGLPRAAVRRVTPAARCTTFVVRSRRVVRCRAAIRGASAGREVRLRLVTRRTRLGCSTLSRAVVEVRTATGTRRFDGRNLACRTVGPSAARSRGRQP